MKNFLFLTLFYTFAFWGCVSEPVDLPAEQLSLDLLTSAPGYSWFPAEMSAYTPNQEMVDLVAANFSDPTRKICLFVKPACACTGTKRLFPQLVKTMVSAGIDMNRVELWSMRGATDKHPYQGTINLTSLPAIYMFKGANITATIADTDYNDHNADTLLAQALAR